MYNVDPQPHSSCVSFSSFEGTCWQRREEEEVSFDPHPCLHRVWVHRVIPDLELNLHAPTSIPPFGLVASTGRVRLNVFLCTKKKGWLTHLLCRYNKYTMRCHRLPSCWPMHKGLRCFSCASLRFPEEREHQQSIMRQGAYFPFLLQSIEFHP